MKRTLVVPTVAAESLMVNQDASAYPVLKETRPENNAVLHKAHATHPLAALIHNARFKMELQNVRASQDSLKAPIQSEDASSH